MKRQFSILPASEVVRPKSSKRAVGTGCAKVTAPPKGGMIFDKSIVPSLILCLEVLGWFQLWFRRVRFPHRVPNTVVASLPLFLITQSAKG